MANTLHLSVVTPSAMIVDQDVTYVGAQGLEGDFGVLPGHAALLAALRVGHIFYKTGDDTRYVFVSGGFAEVSNNKVIILAETATRVTYE